MEEGSGGKKLEEDPVMQDVGRLQVLQGEQVQFCALPKGVATLPS